MYGTNLLGSVASFSETWSFPVYGGVLFDVLLSMIHA